MLEDERDEFFARALTDGSEGLDLLNEGFWRSYPQGSCYGRMPDAPTPCLHNAPEPDSEPIHEWVRQKLANGPKRWKMLLQDLQEEIWVDKQLNAVIRAMRNRRELDGIDYPNRFNSSNDSLSRLLPRQGELSFQHRPFCA